jgi:hypothetical protein
MQGWSNSYQHNKTWSLFRVDNNLNTSQGFSSKLKGNVWMIMFKVFFERITFEEHIP